MAGINRYERARELISKLKKKYDVTSIETLRANIMRELASNEKTILVYLQIMRDTGLIKDTPTGWKLNDNKNISEGS